MILHETREQPKWIFKLRKEFKKKTNQVSVLQNESWIRGCIFFPESDFPTTFRGFFLRQAMVAGSLFGETDLAHGFG